MKLIIQVPCYNEAGQIAATLGCLPRSVPGFQEVEWLVVDDGSTDGTAELARAAGADHVLRLSHNQGLAKAFMAGLEAALGLGADIIVNTDGDNQYRADGIPALVAPILAGRAQIVIGERPIDAISHFSGVKRALQRLGSWVVRMASGTAVPDAPSGFRAIHRDAAVRMHVFNRYTYTLEMIIQAGRLGIPVSSVKVGVNAPTRDSRLVRSIFDYVVRSGITIVRIFMLYQPFRFFGILALLTGLPGFAAFLRFLFFYFSGDGSGHVQSLTIGAALIAVSAMIFVGGLLAELIAANRVLLAEIRGRLITAELRASSTRPDSERNKRAVRQPALAAVVGSA